MTLPHHAIIMHHTFSVPPHRNPPPHNTGKEAALYSFPIS